MLALVAALAFAGAAAAKEPNDPAVHLRAADQAAATASELRASALGAAWSPVGLATPATIKIPICPTAPVDYGHLTLTGHAESAYTLRSAGILVDADVEVFASAGEVSTLFRLMLGPGLASCLRYDLFKSVGTLGRIGAVETLPLAGAGSEHAAYRLPLTYTLKGAPVPVVADYLFVAARRTVFFVNLVAPRTATSELGPLERGLARSLAAGARA